MKKLLLVFFFIALNLFGDTFSDIELLINSNRVKEAEMKLENLATNKWEFNFLMGKLKFYQHEYDDAEEYFEEAYKLNEGNLDCNLYQKRCIYEGSNSIFGMTSRLNNYVEAIDKGYSVNSGKYAQFYIEFLPFMYLLPPMAGGDKEKAQGILDKLKKDKKNYEFEISQAYIEILEYKIKLGQDSKYQNCDEIETIFEGIENQYPNRATTKKYFYTFYKVTEDYERGIKFAEKFNHPLDYYYYGYYQTKMKSDIEKGILNLEKYLLFDIDISKDYPQYADAHKLLAILYNDNKNKIKAITHIDKAIELDPGGIDKYEDVKDIIED